MDVRCSLPAWHPSGDASLLADTDHGGGGTGVTCSPTTRTNLFVSPMISKTVGIDRRRSNGTRNHSEGTAMARRHVDDHSFERNKLVAFTAIVVPLATVLAVPECGSPMTTKGARICGFCSANTDAALACLVDRIVSISHNETTACPYLAPRWESAFSHRAPTVMHWRIVHRTNRTHFDPLTGTDIGPGSDQPHRYGVWSDHLRSIGTTRFGPVCPAWSGEEIGGNSKSTWHGFRSHCFHSQPASR